MFTVKTHPITNNIVLYRVISELIGDKDNLDEITKLVLELVVQSSKELVKIPRETTSQRI